MPDLKDGESVEVKGSAAKPYVIRNVGGVFSCTCPAWRNQSLPIERRTCKHIRRVRGEQAERERLGQPLVAATRETTAGAKGKKPDVPPLLLANSWDSATDLKGWWMSEKLDGVRAYWDGQSFQSRQGNRFHAPDWFIDALPKTPLDGELWVARQSFQKTISIVRRQDKSERWKEVQFVVFDAPNQSLPFEQRLEFLTDLFKKNTAAHSTLLSQKRCKSLSHLSEELARVQALGGEGLMLREPGSHYAAGRSATLLKVKSFLDAEATVIAHQAGKGRHKGRLGAVVARLADGTEFSIGTGFSDKQRANPPAVGSVVTFRYQELSDRGVPRFPSFVRVHKS